MTSQEQAPYVIFDGTCGFCNRFVVFALRRDRSGSLCFVSNHSAKARELLSEAGLTGIDAETVVVFCEGRAMLRSSAMLFVASKLTWPWRWMAAFRIVPRFLRDAVYGIVSRNRLKIFGKVEECALLPPELRSRIIE